MTAYTERIPEFAGYLRKLAPRDEQDDYQRQASRRALADLRSGLGQTPGSAPRMLRQVGPFLDDKPDTTDRWFFLVGSLYPLNPVWTMVGTSLGGSFAHMREQDEMNESGEARFLALLNCHADDLVDQLRGAITLLKAKEIGIDWQQLLSDLCRWHDPERPVQERWARNFYRHCRPDADENTDNAASTDRS